MIISQNRSINIVTFSIDFTVIFLHFMMSFFNFYFYKFDHKLLNKTYFTTAIPVQYAIYICYIYIIYM